MTTYGIIGSGSFGTAMANIIAENANVLLYTRRAEVCENINKNHTNKGRKVHERVQASTDLQEVCERCELIFPLVPSADLRNVMRQASDFLKPHHILIHGIKGLQVHLPNGEPWDGQQAIRSEYVQTMTRVILDETVVLRVGCLSGPNLAMELEDKQPAATVVASHFDEVIKKGQLALKSDRFRVYRSHDLLGVELSGVLKNIMAIAAGMLHGKGYGENAKAMLITRGLGEMVRLGKALGSETNAFFGLAGIGDLIATCSSNLSRNFMVGYKVAQGKTLEQVLADMTEVAEGLNTIKLGRAIGNYYHLDIPIVRGLYQILYEGADIDQSMQNLMHHPTDIDVDYLPTVKG